MKKALLTIATILALPASSAFAGRTVNMPDGSTCILSNDGDVIISCSGGARQARESDNYRNSSPSNCGELKYRIDEINNNLRSGRGGAEFERQKQLRRQYESQYRSSCR